MTAVPFTIAGIALKDVGFDLFHAPPSLHLLVLLLGAVDFFMAMAIVDARLGQYRYARTVNLIRAYFADMDKDHHALSIHAHHSDDSIFRQARIRGLSGEHRSCRWRAICWLRYALGIRAEDPTCPLTQAAFLRLPSPLSTWLRISCTEPGVLWRWSENVSPSDPSTRFATVIPKRRVLLSNLPARSGIILRIRRWGC